MEASSNLNPDTRDTSIVITEATTGTATIENRRVSPALAGNRFLPDSEGPVRQVVLSEGEVKPDESVDADEIQRLLAEKKRELVDKLEGIGDQKPTEHTHQDPEEPAKCGASSIPSETSVVSENIPDPGADENSEIQRLLAEKKQELLEKFVVAPENIPDHSQISQPCQPVSELKVTTDDADCQPPQKRPREEDISAAVSEEILSVKRAKADETTGVEKTETVNDNSQENLLSKTTEAEGEQMKPFYSAPVEITSDVQLESITGAWSEFDSKTDSNFLKGCKWSPDGSCLLTNSQDNCLRIFNLPAELHEQQCTGLPELMPALKIQEGELIYDYAWYPQMSSSDPDTCCLVSTGRDTPVHMWDAFSGKLRGSYRAFDQMDELTAAHSLAFSLDSSRLYCGFNKMIRVFDVARPGRQCQKRPTYVKQGQSGIISCIAVNPADRSMYAAGSYSKTVALYTEPKGEMYCMFQGQIGGVTHLLFSPDGNRLYSGGRKDPEILCWDLRNPGRILAVMNRRVDTNQRVYFDLDSTGKYLVSGDTCGSVTVWEVSDLGEDQDEDEDAGDPKCDPKCVFGVTSGDTVSGVGFHPTLPLLATASGQRHFPLPSGLDSSDSEAEGQRENENSLRLHWLKNRLRQMDTDTA